MILSPIKKLLLYLEITQKFGTANSESVTPGPEVSNNAQHPSLHCLAAQGKLAKVKEEMQKGVDLNAPDQEGLTPLMWAAAHRQKSVIKLLLEHKADPNIEGLGGETPLLFAASQGQSNIVDQLLNHGANINHTDLEGGTALMYAVLGGFTELVRKLLEYGADMTIKNENNETFYNLATTVGNQAVINVIEDYIKNILENS
ncbi:ankyrin repeat family A protein 2-like isoform X2 [Xenia sp. Carnegie-2017]|uniref:ankyrin repeat family A protein 2-like isoform X2 n=1 Tax=Xenia sp. Carnegie-2017 TaxID=2897299 RepID=UPI001F0436F1|nr:ankyrin repeat family A protein 2-like isoform X2 [Xenia sp. Carnegie-2017]